MGSADDFLAVAHEVAGDIATGAIRIDREPGLDLPEEWQLQFHLSQRLLGLPGAREASEMNPEMLRPAVEAYWKALLRDGTCETYPTYCDGTPSDDECDLADFLDDRFACFLDTVPRVRVPGGGLVGAFRRAQAAAIGLVGLPAQLGRRFTLTMSTAYWRQVARGPDAAIVLGVEQLGTLLVCHPSAVSRFLSRGEKYGLLVPVDARWSFTDKLAKLWKFNLASQLYLPPPAARPARGDGGSAA